MIGLIGRRKMQNDNEVRFHQLPIASNSIKLLGSLVFDERSILGEHAYLDLRHIKSHPILARNFISCLTQLVTPTRISSDLSLRTYSTAIKIFINFCESKQIKSNFNFSNLTNSILKEFKHYLTITYSDQRSGNLRRKYGNISRLIEAGKIIGLTPDYLILPSNFKEKNDSDTTEPYTTTEDLDLEHICRKRINETLLFLDEGKKLIKLGSNPIFKQDRNITSGQFEKSTDKGWSFLPNILWFVINILDGKYLSRSELTKNKYWNFINAVSNTEMYPHNKVDVYRRLYPLAYDLIPFIVLISKKTGLNESSTLSLNRDCLKEIDGKYYLYFEKKRGTNRGKNLEIFDQEEFSAVYLIKTLHEITSSLVRHADLKHQNHLFLALTVRGRTGKTIKPIDPSYSKYQMNNKNGWCVKNKLLDQNNLQLKISTRSLRVTKLNEEYKKAGNLANVARRAFHKSIDTTKLYTHNEALKDTHEQTAEMGIKKLLFSTKPQIINQDLILLKENISSKILSGEQDVFFSACSDIYNRPGGKPNSKCEKPWECFTCSNAIFTRHTLPRVLAFRDFMLKEKKEIPSIHWDEKFKNIWKIIEEDIISKFDSMTLDKAEIASKNTSLYIPIVFKIR